MIIEPGTILLDQRLTISFQHRSCVFRPGKSAKPWSPSYRFVKEWLPLCPARAGRSVMDRAAACQSGRPGDSSGSLSFKIRKRRALQTSRQRESLAIIWHVTTHTGSAEPIVRASRHGNVGCTFIDFSLPTASAPQLTRRFHLCSYEEFSAATGVAPPDPMETETVYGGWLLP
jgi:hypothetical protein